MSTTLSQDAEATRRIQKNSSSGRFFYVGMALYMIGIVLVGFWPTYFGLPFSGGDLSEGIAQGFAEGAVVNASWLIHLHVIVFLGWIGLFLTQTILAARGQTGSHIKLGRWGFLLGIGALAVGLFIVLQRHRGAVLLGDTTWGETPLTIWRRPGWVDMIQFSLLLALGFRYRTRPEMHKRLMLFATAIFLAPAFGRMGYLGAWRFEVMVLAIAGPVLAYDLYTERRIHPASLIGTGVLGADLVMLYLLR